jgi:hypothetical protein
MYTTDEINNKIATIQRQTDYNEAEAKKQLEQCGYDHILVIKKFLGISDTKISTSKKSLNQETYRLIRTQLDSGVREFKERTLKETK